MIFRTTRSCFMRSKRGGHGWPLTEMTMQIGRSAIGLSSMSHTICVVTVVNNTGFICSTIPFSKGKKGRFKSVAHICTR
jgi:hypothetical protein